MREDWVEVSLAKDLNYIKTGVPDYTSTKKYYSTGSIKNDSINAEGSYTFNERPSRANRVGNLGDVLQARMKDTDKAIIINEKFNNQLFSTGFFQIRPNNKTLISEYVFYYFKSYLFLNEKDKNCSGSTQSALNDKSAQNLKIPLPPIPIQRAIISRIEELFSDLDNGIANLEKAQAQLKVYRQAVLKKAFEGELTKEWRAKQTDLPSAEELLNKIKTERENHYQQQLTDWKEALKEWETNGKDGKKPRKPSEPKELLQLTEEELKELPKLPNQWDWNRLVKLTSKLSDGPFGSNLKTDDYVDKGIQVIRLENIKNLYFDNSKKTYVTEEKYNSISQHTVYSGDIIFSTFIADETKVATVPFSIDFAINKADCLCVRPFKLISNKYIEYYLATRQTYSQLITQVHGATRPRINSTQLKNLPIPLCATEEQNQIVQEIESRLSVCEQVEKDIAESLEKAEALRQSILKKAFEGKLLTEVELEACRQEPDWEPASVLLDKIKAEKKIKN